MDAYYEKKKDEIKLTEEELKIVKNALLEPILNMKIENTNNDLFNGLINNQNKVEEKKDNPIIDNNRINNINNNNIIKYRILISNIFNYSYCFIL